MCSILKLRIPLVIPTMASCEADLAYSASDVYEATQNMSSGLHVGSASILTYSTTLWCIDSSRPSMSGFVAWSAGGLFAVQLAWMEPGSCFGDAVQDVSAHVTRMGVIEVGAEVLRSVGHSVDEYELTRAAWQPRSSASSAADAECVTTDVCDS